MPSRKPKRLTFKTKPEMTSWDEIVAMWSEAQATGVFDGGWLYDHLYPIYGEPTGPCFEGWTALSYLAGRFEDLRLGLMVTAIPYRNPAVLTKMATTFDHFSGGRLDLGLGCGWNEDEARSFGMPLLPIGERLDQFDEACQIIRELFTEDTVTFHGDHYQLSEARCEPRPVQKPYPPLCMGGAGEKRMLKLVARYADDWNYPGGTTEDFKHKIDVLHSHCATEGRDPSDITVSCHVFVADEPEQTAESARQFFEAGAEHLCLYFMDNSKPELVAPTAEAVVAAVG